MTDSASSSPPGDESGNLAREIQPGIFWLHSCHGVPQNGTLYHQFISAYLILGRDAAVLVDTGHPNNWQKIEKELDHLLGKRQIDWLAPTHPEPPHAGNLRRLLIKYPDAHVIADVRDYHLHLPEFSDRLMHVVQGGSVDLGGGSKYTILPAPIRDLASSVWGYETKSKVMFVADGFAYVHPNPAMDLSDGDEDIDVTVHLPGECDLFSEELAVTPLDVDRARWITRAVLSWSRYVDPGPVFREVEQLMAAYPPQMIAPAHGNVISNPDEVLPVIREAFEQSYAESRQSQAGTPASVW